MVRLRVQAAAALLLIAALLACALISFSTAQSDLHELASVSRPRAAAAADLYQTLADLDAQHAKSLVVGYSAAPPADGQPPTLVDDGVLASLTAQADRSRLGGDLTLLAQTSDTAGRSAVQSLLDSLSSYDALTGTEEFSATSQTDPVVGRPPVLALDYYDQAEGLLQQTLLPTVRGLLAGADQQVSADRSAAADHARLGALLLGLIGLVALVLMVWWQVDVARRHGRLLNPALLAATAALLAVALAGGLALLGAAGRIVGAVHDGYAPAAAVAQAQVSSANAEAVESRWLVDGAYRPSLQQQFDVMTRQLPGELTGVPGSGVASGPEAAFLTADSTLRSLAQGGQPDQAAVQLTGVTRGQIAFAYFDFSSRLGDLAAQRAAVFDSGVQAAGDDLSDWTAIAPVALGPALLLVVLGVRPRLAEYS
ncbi:hypothetical protein [Streptacidiphilus sp. EB129]|uniref:hypothetical protein n=1 Tax=Streptacidiphilus sp. EB129 TaxID=3156262 RepID=UPI0035125BEA